MPGKERIVQCGQVRWGILYNSGYKGGLEELNENNISFRTRSATYSLCKNIAIAIIKPGAEEMNVVKTSQKLLEKGVITQEELDYIYSQFGFDPNGYTPPKWLT